MGKSSCKSCKLQSINQNNVKDALVWNKGNSIALAMELRLFHTKSSIWLDVGNLLMILSIPFHSNIIHQTIIGIHTHGYNKVFQSWCVLSQWIKYAKSWCYMIRHRNLWNSINGSHGWTVMHFKLMYICAKLYPRHDDQALYSIMSFHTMCTRLSLTRTSNYTHVHHQRYTWRSSAAQQTGQVPLRKDQNLAPLLFPENSAWSFKDRQIENNS